MLQRSPDLAPPTTEKPLPSVAGHGANVDRQLYKNLVEMLPLVESLMDRRVNSAYSRRAPMVYTPAPPKPKKADSKGEKAPLNDSEKQRVLTESTEKVEQDSTSNGNENVKKYEEEIVKLREQIENLQQKLLEKDEALRTAQSSVDEMSSIYVTLNNLRHVVGEKDALIQSTNSQLNNAKMLLAEKQAALEKLEWEVRASNSKIDELEECMGLMEFEISSLMKLFEKLCEDSSACTEDFTIPSHRADADLHGMENGDEMKTERMNQEMRAYMAALAAARENPSDEFLVAVAEARTRLHAVAY
ncbi:TMV-MP30 binding protein 2C [Rhynchospora pubera]|uniref:TMV-MP30 binding protein 2C n=1 Tax=Rhynchospora pubera TaxID=906938 RepID=A0AAV8FL09_9POAL|nr:TMV-MP30 binding protein 2C [Rhynchospora pubera]